MKDLVVVWRFRNGASGVYYWVRNESVYGSSTSLLSRATRLDKAEADWYRDYWLNHPDLKTGAATWDILVERAGGTS